MAYMTRQELCNAVYHAVLCSKSELSRLEIARTIGRAKSPHVIHMIEELRDGGWLIENVRKNKFGKDTLVYRAGRLPVVDAPA